MEILWRLFESSHSLYVVAAYILGLTDL